MLATLITLARFPLLAAVVATLYHGSSTVRLIGVAVLLVGLGLDSIDGIVARHRNESSLLGSVLDIAADRTYELVLWFCYAELGLIPMVVPLLVVARTALTDAIRAVGVRDGAAPFAQLEGKVSRFLVSSAWMRTGYSLVKVSAFVVLGASLVFGNRAEWREAGLMLSWLALGLCLLRGVPVIIAGTRLTANRREEVA